MSEANFTVYMLLAIIVLFMLFVEMKLSIMVGRGPKNEHDENAPTVEELNQMFTFKDSSNKGTEREKV